jgi:prepilin-type N-terminal cleavage/methylation domain-containing protein
MLEVMNCLPIGPAVASDDFRNQRGFTLAEMMVVMAMITLVLGVTLPNLWRAAVRADMMGQVGMVQQSVGVSRMYAIKNSSRVALQFLPDSAPVAKYAIHAWVDDNANGALDAGEEEVGRWPMSGEITINIEEGNSNHTLHSLAGTALGVVFLANGMAIVHDNQIGTGQGAVVLQDTYENKLRIIIQGGSGSVLTDMWNYDEEDWIPNPKNLWRY